MWRTLTVYLLVIGGVVLGAWWYLNRPRCEPCEARAAAARVERCRAELARYRIDESGDYVVGYVDRIRLALQGCWRAW